MSTVTPRLGLTKPAGIEQFNLATYNTNLDLIDTESINVAKNGSGSMVFARYNATSSAITTLTVVFAIPTFTFKANRKYKITFIGNGYTSDNTSTFLIAVQTCLVSDPLAQTTGLSQVRPRAIKLDTALEGRSFDFTAPNVTFGSDTTLQIKFTAQRLSGGGGITITGNNTDPCEMVIEDLGLNF